MHKILENEEKQPGMKVGLEQSTAMICKKCGGDIFLEGSKFRVISKLLVGTQQDAIIPVPCFLCGNCGDVLQELLPKQLQTPNQNEVDTKII